MLRRAQLTSGAVAERRRRFGVAVARAAGWLAIAVSMALAGWVAVRGVVNPLNLLTVSLGSAAGGLAVIADGNRRRLLGALVLLFLTIGSAMLSVVGFLYVPSAVLVLVAGGTPDPAGDANAGG